MELREYQKNAIQSVKKGGNNLVYMSTGAGKSIIFKKIIEKVLESKRTVLFLVARRQVITQAYEKHFSGFEEKSIMMGAKKYELSPLLCASIDTLCRRKNAHSEIIDMYDIIIIDEAHDTTSNKYREFLNKIPKEKTIIGFTATPFRVGKKGHTFWDNVIHNITTQEIINKGFLVPPKVFAAKKQMNTTKKTSMGDYNNKALFQENDNMIVYGNIIKEYKQKAFGKKAFCFAINIQHSIALSIAFNNAGIKAVHVDASSSEQEREKALCEFENGDVMILCNVNLYSTGTDIPISGVGIMARPTKSRLLWIQQVGRILRTYTGKTEALILDHGGNCERLGHPLTDFPAELTDVIKKEKSDEDLGPEIQLRKCPNCFYILLNVNDELCPECGESVKTARKIKEERDAELKEIEFRINKEVQEDKAFKTRKEIDLILKRNFIRSRASLSQRQFVSRRVAIILSYDKKPKGLFHYVWAEYGQASQSFMNYPGWFLKIKGVH